MGQHKGEVKTSQAKTFRILISRWIGACAVEISHQSWTLQDFSQLVSRKLENGKRMREFIVSSVSKDCGIIFLKFDKFSNGSLSSKVLVAEVPGLGQIGGMRENEGLDSIESIAGCVVDNNIMASLI